MSGTSQATHQGRQQAAAAQQQQPLLGVTALPRKRREFEQALLRQRKKELRRRQQRMYMHAATAEDAASGYSTEHEGLTLPEADLTVKGKWGAERHESPFGFCILDIIVLLLQLLIIAFWLRPFNPCLEQLVFLNAFVKDQPIVRDGFSEKFAACVLVIHLDVRFGHRFRQSLHPFFTRRFPSGAKIDCDVTSSRATSHIKSIMVRPTVGQREFREQRAIS